MRIFLDTNVVLDSVFQREGQKSTQRIMGMNSSFTRCCTSFLSLANTAYIIRKGRTIEEVKQCLKEIERNCKILPMGDQMFYNALKCKSPDFEDSLQIQCAEFEGCDVIITRNVSHFKAYTPLPVMTPEEFLSLVGK